MVITEYTFSNALQDACLTDSYVTNKSFVAFCFQNRKEKRFFDVLYWIFLKAWILGVTYRLNSRANDTWIVTMPATLAGLLSLHIAMYDGRSENTTYKMLAISVYEEIS